MSASPHGPKVTYLEHISDALGASNPAPYVSQEAFEVLGYPAQLHMDDADGTWWDSLVHPEDLERYHRECNHSFASLEPYEVDYRVKHATGEWIWTRDEAHLVTEGTRQFWLGSMQALGEAEEATG